MVKIHSGKEFQAMASGDANNNTIFLDTSDDIIKIKDNSGNIQTIENKENDLISFYYDDYSDKYFVNARNSCSVFLPLFAHFSGGNGAWTVVDEFPKCKLRFESDTYGGDATAQGFFYIGEINGNDDAEVTQQNWMSEPHQMLGLGNSTTYDYDDDGTMVVRYSSSDLNNPETGFAAYGSEFSAGEYSDTKDEDANLYGMANEYVVVKIPLQDSSKDGIAPIFCCEVGTTTGSAQCYAKLELFIWDIESNEWLNLGGMRADKSNDTAGHSFLGPETSEYGCYLGFPIKKSFVNDSGFMYVKLKETESGNGYGNLIRIAWIEGDFHQL